MGSEDLFHRRKARGAASLARRKAKRPPYEKVLIVCEGRKTEPLYFCELVAHYKLSSANVKILGDPCGSAPESILAYARDRFIEEKNTGDPFNKVYCVFDKDAHTSYQEACSQITKIKPSGVFHAITSVPSFEYWLLLHFVYTTKPYMPLSNKSAGDQVLSELKKYMPSYKKNSENTFMMLLEQLDFAKFNAMRSSNAAKESNVDNPSTTVHELVDYLQNLKE